MSCRIKKLLVKMKALKIDAMLIGSRANRFYMSGFTGSNGMLYLSKNKQILITDFRYLEQVGKQCSDFEVMSQGNAGLIKTALSIAEEDGAAYIGFESDHTNTTTYLELGTYEKFKFIATQNIIETFRQIKDEDEISKLKEAEHIGDLAFSHIVPFITAHIQKGITENDIAFELESFMRKNGAAATSFSTIAATGAKSSQPHAEPGDEMLKKGDFVVLDFGCVYQGYCSDMTRTLVIGEPTARHRHIYETVLKAQQTALGAIKPGLLGQEIDAVARQVIIDAGFGDNFGHGLGHSVGLEIHESPRFSPLDTTRIEAGMVMTVEPGIYIGGFGGVRIEDLVVVTENGIKNLTHSPKELISIT